MKCAVVVFSGTNCDVDVYRACELVGWQPEYIQQNETDLSAYDVIIIPGTMSFEGNSNSIKIAKYTPVIGAIKEYIKNKKGFVLAICSGFHLLCEAGILPGILTPNENNKFICDDIELIFTEYKVNRTIVLPIAHSEGKFYADPKTLTEIDNKNMVFLKYKLNPNGSISNIAGLYDSENLVIGMMPHPEKAVCKELGLVDGKRIFDFIKIELEDARSKAL